MMSTGGMVAGGLREGRALPRGRICPLVGCDYLEGMDVVILHNHFEMRGIGFSEKVESKFVVGALEYEVFFRHGRRFETVGRGAQLSR